MSFFEFPHTRTYDSDLGWVISAVKALKEAMETFVAANSLTFADPLEHSILSEYNKNTIVLDPQGNAYISLQQVPKGITLDNADYWLMVFDYEAFLEKVNKNFTGRYYRNQNRATSPMIVGDWLTFEDVLCKVTDAIAIDDIIELGVNIEHFTLEDFIKAFMTSANQMIQQYKNDIDASELAYRQQLAHDIEVTTASLQAQLDQAISGATVDSEVINARVSIANITYDTLKDNLDTQFSELSELLPISVTYGKYVNYTTGVESAQASYDCTGYIRCDIFDVAVRTTVDNDLAGIAFYDANRTYLSGYNPYDDNGSLVTLTKPDRTVYVKVSFKDSYKKNFLVKYVRIQAGIRGNIPALNNVVTEVNTARSALNGITYSNLDARLDSDFGQLIDLMPSRLSGGYFVNKNTGNLSALATYGCTDYIRCDVFDIECRTKVDEDNSGIAFYDVNKRFISGYNPYSDNETFATLTRPDGAVYVRISCKTNYNNSFLVRYINIEKNTSDLATNPLYSFNALKVFDKITCCGDSLTYSLVYTGAGTSRQAKKTYPKMLGEYTGATVNTLAVSGYSASDWWAQFENSLTSDSNKLAIIYLGTNGGLTDTLATDAPSADPYNTWANTNTGCYAKIIAKAQDLGLKVLLVKVYATDGDLDITNDVIRQCASRFHCGIIENPYIGNAAMHYYPDLSGSNTVHYNDIGYAAFTSQLIKQVGIMRPTFLRYLIPS